MLKLATKFAPRLSAFETAYRAGFRAAELWLDADLLASWQQVAALAGHYPFEHVLHFPNRLDLPPPALEQVVRLHRALGGRCLVIHEPMLDRYGEALLRLDSSLVLAVENHPQGAESFARWAEHSPGLTLDVEHLWMMPLYDGPLERLLDEVRHFLERHGPRLHHVHLPGYWPGCRTHRPLYCSRELAFPILTLLAEHDFEGLIVSEADEEYQNADELRMTVLLFEAWRARHDRRVVSAPDRRPP